MARKISIKIALVIFFLDGYVLMLCACLVPIDLPAFMDDPRVVGIIESGKAKVIIDKEDGDFAGLIEGDSKISGLDTDKYYLVEKVKDTNGGAVGGYPKYVSDLNGPGRLEDYLGGITRISGGSINGLTNFYTYIVKTAKSFTDGAITYREGGSDKPVTVTDGKVTITSAGTGNITLDLTNTLIPGTDYEIIPVAAYGNEATRWNSLYGEHQSLYNDNWDFLPLEGEGTIVDYVIIELDSSYVPVVPVNFMFLTVEVEEKPTVTFTLTFSDTDHASITGGPASISIASVTGAGSVTFTLAPHPTGSWTSYSWKIAGTEYSTSNTLVFSNANIGGVLSELVLNNTIEITVTAVDNLTVPYSDTVEINIVP
jgi:hypothetical protein